MGVVFMRKEIIMVLLLALIISLSVSAASAFSLFGKENTKLAVICDDSIDPGDDLKVNLTKNNGNPVDNVTVNVTLTDSDGLNKTFSILTNKSGIAKLQLNDSGKYSVNCTFAGNDNLKASNATKNVTVNYIEEDSDEYYDYGAFYSEQAGRVIYTGEIHEGPDGCRYEHLGYNEWRRID